MWLNRTRRRKSNSYSSFQSDFPQNRYWKWAGKINLGTVIGKMRQHDSRDPFLLVFHNSVTLGFLRGKAGKLYRVTIQVVQNLPLILKQKLRFST